MNSGPFAGMKYIREACGSAIIPKLLGSYELELHDTVYKIISREPQVIVDIGCAEGYYAVGFAGLLPDVKIYAYDINPVARANCAQLASLNGVTNRVIVRGKCDSDELQSLPLDGAVVICDCEGYELELLDPVKVPELSRAILLVELHDCFVPGLSDKLLERFKDTHDISLISIRERDPSCYQSLVGLKPAYKWLAIDEGRQISSETNKAQWAYLAPKFIDKLTE